jgi:hypothetical protein
VWEAATDGLERLALWFDGEIDGPIRVLYPHTLSDTSSLPEIASPVRLFDIGQPQVD